MIVMMIIRHSPAELMPDKGKSERARERGGREQEGAKGQGCKGIRDKEMTQQQKLRRITEKSQVHLAGGNLVRNQWRRALGL